MNLYMHHAVPMRMFINWIGPSIHYLHVRLYLRMCVIPCHCYDSPYMYRIIMTFSSAFYVHKIIRCKLCLFFAIAFVSSSFAHVQYTLKVKRLIILRYVVKISILVHVFQHFVRLSSIAVNCLCERVAVDRQKSVVYRMGQIHSTMLWYSFWFNKFKISNLKQ